MFDRLSVGECVSAAPKQACPMRKMFDFLCSFSGTCTAAAFPANSTRAGLTDSPAILGHALCLTVKGESPVDARHNACSTPVTGSPFRILSHYLTLSDYGWPVRPPLCALPNVWTAPRPSTSDSSLFVFSWIHLLFQQSRLWTVGRCFGRQLQEHIVGLVHLRLTSPPLAIGPFLLTIIITTTASCFKKNSFFPALFIPTLGRTLASQVTPTQHPPTLDLLHSIDTAKRTVTLKCHAEGYYPKGITMTWSVDDSPEPQGVIVEQRVNRTYSTMIQREVPMDQWSEGKSYTCAAQHTGTQSETKKNTSKSDWALPSAPVVNIEGYPPCMNRKLEDITLQCHVTKFYPKEIWVTWLVNGSERRGRNKAITKGMEESYQTTSELTVPSVEWNKGTMYSCSVTHGKGNSTELKNISKCAVCNGSIPEPSLYLLPPSAEDLIVKNTVNLTCFVVGYELTHSAVTWEVDGKPQGGAVQEYQAMTEQSGSQWNGTQSITSWLSLEKKTWTAVKRVACRVAHPCLFPPTEKQIKRTAAPLISHAPTVELLQSTVSQGKLILTCHAYNYSPKGITLKWLVDQIPSDTQPFPTEESVQGRYSATSQLPVPREAWEQGKSYSCEVQQAGAANKDTKTTSKSDWSLPSAPVVTMLGYPSCQHRELGDIHLQCLVANFYPEEIRVTWLVDGSEQEGKSRGIAKGPDDKYGTSNELTVLSAEWNKGTAYSCSVSHARASPPQLTNISKCAVCQGNLPEPVVFLAKPSIQDVMTLTRVKLTCLVLGYELYESTLTWEADGLERTEGVSVEKIWVHPNQTQSLTGTLSMDVGVWRTGKTFSCRVNHPCLFPEKKAEINKTEGPSESAPSLSLLAPSPSQLTRMTSAILVCEVTNFYPAEIFLVWEKDREQIPDSEYVNLPPIPQRQANRFSMVSLLKIPMSQWSPGSTYTCMVGHQSSLQMMQKSETGLFDFLKPSPPKVTVLYALEGESNKTLLCIMEGHHPKNISMAWQVEGKAHSCIASSLAQLENNKFLMSCSLSVTKEEWSNGHTYTCEVRYYNGTSPVLVERQVNSIGYQTAVPITYIIKPSFEELVNHKNATITCLSEMRNASMRWEVDGKAREAGVKTEELTFDNGSIWSKSTLPVTLSEWNATGTFACQPRYLSGESPQQTISRNLTTGAMKPPVIYLLSPFADEVSTHELTLVCLVNGFYPEDLFVTWENGTEEDFAAPINNVVRCNHSSQLCSLTSQLAVPRTEWLAGTLYTCVVSHISSEQRLKKSISHNTDKLVIEDIPRDYHDEGGLDLSLELDEASSVWTTASTFIALFLLTLLYSSFVTFVKVK